MQLEPVDQAAKVLLKTKNKNNSYVILFDQNPVGTKQIAWMKWPNQTTKINLSPTPRCKIKISINLFETYIH